MRKCLTNFSWIFKFAAVQKCVNLVDLVKSFQSLSMSLFLNLLFEPDSYSYDYAVSRFDKAERSSEKDFRNQNNQMIDTRLWFINHLLYLPESQWRRRNSQLLHCYCLECSLRRFSRGPIAKQPGGSVHGERANFTRLVLGCIDADFCK